MAAADGPRPSAFALVRQDSADAVWRTLFTGARPLAILALGDAAETGSPPSGFALPGPGSQGRPVLARTPAPPGATRLALNAEGTLLFAAGPGFAALFDLAAGPAFAPVEVFEHPGLELLRPRGDAEPLPALRVAGECARPDALAAIAAWRACSRGGFPPGEVCVEVRVRPGLPWVLVDLLEFPPEGRTGRR